MFLRLGSYLGNDLRRLWSLLRSLLRLLLRLRLALESLRLLRMGDTGLRLRRGSSLRGLGLTMSARLLLRCSSGEEIDGLLRPVPLPRPPFLESLPEADDDRLLRRLLSRSGDGLRLRECCRRLWWRGLGDGERDTSDVGLRALRLYGFLRPSGSTDPFLSREAIRLCLRGGDRDLLRDISSFLRLGGDLDGDEEEADRVAERALRSTLLGGPPRPLGM